MRVDPALLGAAAPAGEPVAPASAPPEVGERPALPPLYSAHVAAGAIPHPATTPFAFADKQKAPTYVSAERIEGVYEVELIASGAARFERRGDALEAERIHYREALDEVEAIGNVRLSSPDTTLTGPRLRMRLEESTGEFITPAYTFRRERKPVQEPALTLTGLPAVSEGGQTIVGTGRMIAQAPFTGSGQAERLEFRGIDAYRLEKASYSTCAPGARDWEIHIDALDLDYHDEIGQGRHAVVRFKDVPIFYTPWLSFSLNDQKKSGFLPPTFGSTSKSGFELATPWFWNIAPHMDATLTPRYLTRRGLQMNGEFRYLLNSPQNRALAANAQLSADALPDKGQLRVEWLPDDRVAQRNRYGYAFTHNQTFLSLVPGHTVTANLNVNGVSDSNYFSDLSTRVATVSQGNLLRQGSLALAGPWYQATLLAQSYQTLQNLTTPYRLLPQLTAQASRYDLPAGLVVQAAASYGHFDHPDKPIARRSVFYPQLSLPLATAALWLTPKLGLHYAHYELERQDLASDPWLKAAPRSQSRAVPIFSVDGGIVLERELALFGQSLLQTLEPRAFYTFIPRRDQRTLPVLDTGLADFNYASMFAENRYAGHDRIGDANQLTLAASSRLIDPISGAELLRAMVGTRYYFTQQDAAASLPGEAVRRERKADILASLAGRVLPNIYADTAWQYNPRDDRTERLSLTGRYRPAPGKIVNVGYRYSRDLLDQIDVSAQWPFAGGWHGVGRYNWSLKEKRVIETIGGLEYNAGCWVGRFVVQRLATIADRPTTALFFQLELNDFSKIGSNPLNLLRRNIPGYGIINQPTADPVFAEN